jgi:hypothetical protein
MGKCTCGHAASGHWRRGGYCLYRTVLVRGVPLCECSQFDRADVLTGQTIA